MIHFFYRTSLLLSTFVIALAVASLVVFIFSKPIDSILKRVVPIEISSAWAKYLKFALYVIGIGGGVRVWDFEKYLTIVDPYKAIIPPSSQMITTRCSSYSFGCCR